MTIIHAIVKEEIVIMVENFIRSLVDKYGKHPVYTDGGIGYPQACTNFCIKT